MEEKHLKQPEAGACGSGGYSYIPPPPLLKSLLHISDLQLLQFIHDSENKEEHLYLNYHCKPDATACNILAILTLTQLIAVLLSHFLISPSRAGFFSFPLFRVLMNRAVDAKMSNEQLHLVTILASIHTKTRIILIIKIIIIIIYLTFRLQTQA